MHPGTGSAGSFWNAQEKEKKKHVEEVSGKTDALAIARWDSQTQLTLLYIYLFI